MSNPLLKKIQSFIGKYYDEPLSHFGRWLKPFIKDAHHGKLEVQYVVRDEMTNPVKNLHGGVMAAIMDEVIGATVFSTGIETFYTTLNLHVDFFAPVKNGETITVKTFLVKEGKQFMNVNCEIFNEAGRLVSRGSANLFRTNIALSDEFDF